MSWKVAIVNIGCILAVIVCLFLIYMFASEDENSGNQSILTASVANAPRICADGYRHDLKTDKCKRIV
jgi:hypothetical protein